MRFKELPKHARAYMLYHVIIAPGLICWYLVPLYMMTTGYSTLEVGWIFSVASAVSVVLVYWIGRIFDKIPIKHGLVTIDVTNSVGYFFYFLAKGGLSGIFLFLGRLTEEISFLFYPLYPAYERIVYPKEKREEILSWHLRLPEISQALTFPVMGFLLGYVFTEPFHYRTVFLLFSLLGIFTVWYLMKFLIADREREKLCGESFSFRFSSQFLRFVVVDCFMSFGDLLAPSFVLINYVVFTLNKTLFEITLIELAMSGVVILSTYITEKAPEGLGKILLIFGILTVAINFTLMAFDPNFIFTLLIYAAVRFGSTLMFPYYRSWMWSFIPPERSAELHAALSSLRRVLRILSPVVAGFLATLHSTLPYMVAGGFYTAAAVLVWTGKHVKSG